MSIFFTFFKTYTFMNIYACYIYSCMKNFLPGDIELITVNLISSIPGY